jgi:hypothetical protein
MSIHEVIAGHLNDRLFRLELIFDSDDTQRDLLISEETKELLEGPWANKNLERRCKRLEADLETFARGKMVRACLNPREHDRAFMGRLAPPADEVWDIRSVDPSPALRVLGSFADRDCFVALTCHPRSRTIKGIDRPPLGPWGSREWRNATNECKIKWRQLFHPYQPVHSETDNIHDYISDSVVLI